MTNEDNLRTQFYKQLKLHAEKNNSCCARCTVSHCCNEPVWCDRCEIEKMMAEYPPEKLPALKERVAAWFIKAQASGLLDIDNEDGTEERQRTGDFTKTYAWRWRQMQLPCPLLEAGRCSVYDNRPSSCALFFAKGEPEWCGDDRRFDQFKVLEWPHFVVHGAMCLVYEECGKPRELYVDHVGVLLHNFLFGTEYKTVMLMRAGIEYTEGGLQLTPKEGAWKV